MLSKVVVAGLCLVSAAAAFGAASAGASHAAEGSTRAAMIKAAFAYAGSNSTYIHFTVRQARISSSSVHWGKLVIAASDGNTATALLKRSGSVWRVRLFGTAFECGSAPRAVLTELVAGCYTPG
jgi:hypothetical protein